MCIVHEPSQHYLFQDLLVSFLQSKILSPLFLKRVGSLLCTCHKELLFDSKNIIETQRSLFKWFDEESKTNEKMNYFKSLIGELKLNGSIDSGTKITLLTLLKDTNELDFSKLRSICSKKSLRKNVFFVKLVRLKFDLKLCSIKEFVDLLNKIDNSAIKYIKLTTKSKITFRDLEHLTIRNFMGELEATIESQYEKNLKNSEFYLKRLTDAVHYRLAQKIPSCDSIVGNVCSGTQSLNTLIQSPPDSTLNDSDSSLRTVESHLDLSELETKNSLKDESNISNSLESFSSSNHKVKYSNNKKFYHNGINIQPQREYQDKMKKLSLNDSSRNELANSNLVRILLDKKQ